MALCVSDAYSCVRALACVGLVELEVRYALVISPATSRSRWRVEVDAEVEEGRAGLVSVEGCVCVCVCCVYGVVFACV